MKRIIIFSMLALSACSYKPVVDLRSSKDAAQLYQRDLYECKQIIKDNRSIWNKPLLGVDPMLDKCLEGRGHSVLNRY